MHMGSVRNFGGHRGIGAFYCLDYWFFSFLFSVSSLLSCLFFLCFYFAGREEGLCNGFACSFFMRKKALLGSWMMMIMINELQ